MKPLIPIPSVLLGPADCGMPRLEVRLTEDETRWVVTWMSTNGKCSQATAPIGAGGWSESVTIPVGRLADVPVCDGGATKGRLCMAEYNGGTIALRAGRRVIGERPTFPGAGLVLTRQVGEDWVDLAFADETPDQEVFAAALGVRGNELVIAYLVINKRVGATCRVMRCSSLAEQVASGAWRQLPDFPLSPGVAAVIAGIHDRVLIAAGGANFPDRPPWEGGIKRTYDEIHALVPGERLWRTVGRLPEPRAYAAVVSLPNGVLAIGGENAGGVLQDSFLLSWSGSGVFVNLAPALPVALASPVAVVLGNKVYLAGGYAAGSPRVSTHSFYCFDLENPVAGWEKLPAWPGPSRALAVIAALNGAVYLASGLEMSAAADGQSQISYLTDAYRYRPGQGWEKLPDLPWSVIAAPSPAPVSSGRIFIFGGVDGRQVGKVPRDRRVPEDIIYFDVARHEWLLWQETWPEPVVSAPSVRMGNEWVFVSGEIKAGHRTTAVVGWQPF
jgi:N-acetylneuraminate epimerase